MSNEKYVSVKDLKKLLHYCPDSGKFTWVSSPSPRVRIGGIACSCDAHGYIVIQLNKRTYKAHRLAFLYMTKKFPVKHIDHINHDRSDNSWANLREVSQIENARNMKLRPENTSGVAGVYFRACWSKWAVSVSLNNKRTHLGLFEDYFEAVCARKSANNKYGFHVNHGNKK